LPPCCCAWMGVNHNTTTSSRSIRRLCGGRGIFVIVVVILLVAFSSLSTMLACLSCRRVTRSDDLRKDGFSLRLDERGRCRHLAKRSRTIQLFTTFFRSPVVDAHTLVQLVTSHTISASPVVASFDPSPRGRFDLTARGWVKDNDHEGGARKQLPDKTRRHHRHNTGTSAATVI
jgi:hypothetical protein